MKLGTLAACLSLALGSQRLRADHHAQDRLRHPQGLPLRRRLRRCSATRSRRARRAATSASNSPSGSLGGEREQIEAVQLGTLDLVNTSTGPVGNFVPEVKIVDIPFLFRDYDHARKVMDGPIGQDMLEEVPEPRAWSRWPGPRTASAT